MSDTNRIRITIGRDPSCDIAFREDQDDVSRVHAEAVWREEIDAVVVRDLGSVNGTNAIDGAVVATDGSIRVLQGQAVEVGEQQVKFETLKQALDRKQLSEEARQRQKIADAQHAKRRQRFYIIFAVAAATVVLAGVIAFVVLERQKWQAKHKALVDELQEVSREAAEDARRQADELLEEPEEPDDPDIDEEIIGPFIVAHGGALLKDRRTGLMWRRCPLGMKWSVDACTGTLLEYAWEHSEYRMVSEAMDRFNADHDSFGYDDWRLPGILEMLTLVEEDAGLGKPEAFPGIPEALYWTSTKWPYENNAYWLVNLEDGKGYWHYADRRMPVLPVRKED